MTRAMFPCAAAVAAALIFGPLASADEAKAPVSSEQASYAAGLTTGDQLHAIGVSSELSVEAFARGLKDGLAGKRATAEDQQTVQQFVTATRDAAGARNAATAADFLAKNGKAKGVTTTASGLQYQVLNAGDAKGASPKPTDQVLVRYHGRLLDGTEFDSSAKNGGPVTLTPAHLIKAWQEALPLMKPGAKWTLYVPPDLGYGNNSRPPIPPNSLLVFDVELVKVVPAPAPQLPSPAPPTAKPQ